MTIFDNSNDFAIFALSRTIRVVFLEATEQKTIVHLSTTKMRGGQQFDPTVSSNLRIEKCASFSVHYTLNFR